MDFESVMLKGRETERGWAINIAAQICYYATLACRTPTLQLTSGARPNSMQAKMSSNAYVLPRLEGVEPEQVDIGM
jgi:hypothetical protein